MSLYLKTSLDTKVFDEISDIVSTIWGTFFAWMPVSLQVAFGAIFALCVVYLALRVSALVMDALPFV